MQKTTTFKKELRSLEKQYKQACQYIKPLDIEIFNPKYDMSIALRYLENINTKEEYKKMVAELKEARESHYNDHTFLQRDFIIYDQFYEAVELEKE
jgi:hypothetical protein